MKLKCKQSNKILNLCQQPSIKDSKMQTKDCLQKIIKLCKRSDRSLASQKYSQHYNQIKKLSSYSFISTTSEKEKVPLSYSHSYYQPYFLINKINEEYILLDCRSRLIVINKNSQENYQFIVKSIKKYAYEIQYTYSIGSILSQISLNWRNWQAELIFDQMYKKFPEIFKSTNFIKSKQMKQIVHKKQSLIKYGILCVKTFLEQKYPQFKFLDFAKPCRWTVLLQNMFQSLMFRFIPSEMSRFLIISLYLNPDKKINQLQKNSYVLIEPYCAFFKLLVSLYHYSSYSKKCLDIHHLYEVCLNPAIRVVEWPIVLANSHKFQLPLPNFQ